ncbi:MAG TPA: polysaccharide deacetylase family protein [Chitinophagales bacterium]|nr:polysaccharide deacetylase family protein [Chitinophagales bacterium]
MYFVHTPYIIKKLFSQFVWDLPNAENKIYLTFDDGPHPEITPWILEQLKKYDAKATFFCLGENAKKYSEIVKRMKANDHAVGSHGDAHLDGWKISKNEYEQNVLTGKDTLENITNVKIDLYRPPYGKFKHKVIQEQTTVMWSLMPGDFDISINPETCFSRLKKTKSGDIIVLHDNDKSWKLLEYCLPKFLEYCREKNFILDKINL